MFIFLQCRLYRVAMTTLFGSNFQGLTPLHLAALSGYDNAIEQLIRDFGKCRCGGGEKERESE